MTNLQDADGVCEKGHGVVGTYVNFCPQCGTKVIHFLRKQREAALPKVSHGLRRAAASTLIVSGLLVTFSGLFPWASLNGRTAGPNGFYVILLVILGGLSIYFGWRALRRTRSIAVIVFAGLISFVDLFLALVAFYGATHTFTVNYDETAHPGIGFAVAGLGFLGTVAGTILLVIVRLKDASDLTESVDPIWRR